MRKKLAVRREKVKFLAVSRDTDPPIETLLTICRQSFKQICRLSFFKITLFLANVFKSAMAKQKMFLSFLKRNSNTYVHTYDQKKLLHSP
ncbi:hypothetical protein AC249_AIPGENE1558 [Exaiptasia diaphana]|nr:hypothetical protein AC249_AIPGENE1558 [Exaiptasia diaphana]